MESNESKGNYESSNHAQMSCYKNSDCNAQLTKENKDQCACCDEHITDMDTATIKSPSPDSCHAKSPPATSNTRRIHYDDEHHHDGPQPKPNSIPRNKFTAFR